MLDTTLHVMTQSADGSYTAYSKEYGEHYHATKEGALYETLAKHVSPALDLKRDYEEIRILDICFGLGFNTLATIYRHKKNVAASKIRIFSPELDASLIRSLVDFNYPQEFESLRGIVTELAQKGVYNDDDLRVELFLGDAREYIRGFQEGFFDIVYQDAFSPSANPSLWTREYFADIARVIKKRGVLTTYSTAFATRLALHENGFLIYLNQGEGFRDATIASLRPIKGFKSVDMEHKIRCNPHLGPLRD